MMRILWALAALPVAIVAALAAFFIAVIGCLMMAVLGEECLDEYEIL